MHAARERGSHYYLHASDNRAIFSSTDFFLGVFVWVCISPKVSIYAKSR